MARELLHRLVQGVSLDADEAAALMARMMDEELTPIQLAGIMIALRAKGETPDEVVGFARTMRARARQLDVVGDLADTCGTGGDFSGTFNISTAAAIIVAACGQPVAKHGNRAASGRCGSADVLEALGVDITLPPDGVAECVREAGIGFLFAPAFHPAMKFAAVPRRELGVRTVFNLLGPLTNPAHPTYQLLGVSSGNLLYLMAEALLKLGVRRALVVHSADGMDEISVSGPTMVREVGNGAIRSYEITPEEFGVERAPRDAVKGGDAETNAAILRAVLDGESGPARDAAVINAAAALYVAGRAPSLPAGADLAQEAIDSGRAAATLESFRAASQRARAHVNSAA
ncbi:MAG TPA: anthranilate phosphoribosyltransferase [Chloroflexota bacterium]|nr:anthranilate phosphoribosyltransferase [Chloroflexota bacterium]